jgi:hypothetical protein
MVRTWHTAPAVVEGDLVLSVARFEGVGVPAPAVVGEVGAAASTFERQVQTALVLQCAFDRYSAGRPLDRLRHA